MSPQQYVVENANVIAKYKEQLAEANEQLMVARAAVDELLARQDQLIGAVQSVDQKNAELQLQVNDLTAKLGVVSEIRQDVDHLTEMVELKE